MSAFFKVILSRKGHAAAVFTVALVSMSGAALAQAGAVVLDAPTGMHGIKKGQELPDDKVIDVPDGKRLLVVVQRGGNMQTVLIEGPRKGTVRELLHPETLTIRVLAVIREFMRTGGSDQTSQTAQRGVRLALDDVPVSGSVKFCVEDGAFPAIGLVGRGEHATVRVTDEGSAENTTSVELTSSKPRVPWPAAAHNRTSYRLLDVGHSEVDLTMLTVPQGTIASATAGSVNALAALEDRGCKLQVGNALQAALRLRN